MFFFGNFYILLKFIFSQLLINFNEILNFKNANWTDVNNILNSIQQMTIGEKLKQAKNPWQVFLFSFYNLQQKPLQNLLDILS